MQTFAWFRFALCALLGFAPLAHGQEKLPVLLVVGDSVSAGYGLSNGQGWVELLTRKLAAEGYRYRVVNASISGDTTAGGRARLPALLAQHKPAVVIVELGGNDALRGGKLATTRDNLDAMVSASQGAGAKVLVVGMEIPPNYGPAYAREFKEVYTGVAGTRKVALVPSRLPVGSSAISSLGSPANARAMATRCCSPPKSWRG
jgi:acyl-CoA thioesterase-1